jgi:hypothetical protein
MNGKWMVQCNQLGVVMVIHTLNTSPLVLGGIATG